jgi:hypothetical protein
VGGGHKKVPAEVVAVERAAPAGRLTAPPVVGTHTPALEIFARGLFMFVGFALGAAWLESSLPGASALLVALGGTLAFGIFDVLRRRLPRGIGPSGLGVILARQSGAWWSLHIAGATLASLAVLGLPWVVARLSGILGPDWLSQVSEGGLAAFLTVVICSSLGMLGYLPELLVAPLLAAVAEETEDRALPPR